ncbi:MAG TPA: pilin [bacterium]|nr:pilin [bacterium]
MSKKKLVIFLILLVIPLSVGAATVSLDNPLKSSGVTSLFDSSAYIGGVIKKILGLIGAISLLLFVYGGFLMILSGGSESKIKEAKNIMVYTATGLAVIFSAYIILNFFLGALGGNLYDEYYDMPASPSVAGEIETNSNSNNCPTGCLKNSSCDSQDESCSLNGCCDSSLDSSTGESDNYTDSNPNPPTCEVIGCTAALSCSLQNSICRQGQCCIP